MGPPAPRPAPPARQSDDPPVAVIDPPPVRAFGGGGATGPSPVGRGKPGTEHPPPADRNGVPPAVRTARAGKGDHTELSPTVLASPKAGGKPGRPKGRPDHPYGDRGFGRAAARNTLAWLGVEPHRPLARAPRGRGLGKVRRVVERTAGRVKGFRRMRVRYDRLLVVRHARRDRRLLPHPPQ